MRILIILALLLVLAVAGCSDDGGERQAEPAEKADAEETSPPAELEAEETSRPAELEADPTPPARAEHEEKTADPEVRMMPIVKGVGLVVHLDSELSTETHRAGHKFTATMREPLMMKTGQALPAGCSLEGEVVLSKRAARVGGKAEMTLEFRQLTTPEGRTYRIFTEPLVLEGESTARGDVEKVVGGTVGGAIIGGVLGGRDGAVKGGAAGGAAGGVWAVATRGNDIVLEAGQGVEATLARDLRVPVTIGQGQ